MAEEMNFFEELQASLQEAVDHKEGRPNRCRTVVRELPVPEYKADDISRMRKSLNLSQKGLASVLGVSARTVEAWEAGRNQPSGAARHLLYLFDCDNSLVNRLIAR